MKHFPKSRIIVIGCILLVSLASVYFLYLKAVDAISAFTWIAGSFVMVLINVWDVRQDNLAFAAAKVELARELIDKGQNLAATESLDLALTYDPNNFDAIVVRGELFRSQQAYADARRELLRAHEINPNSFRVHFALGLVYLQEKKVLEAISEFKQTIQLKPDFCESYYILASAFELSGQKESALITYRKFIEIVTSEDLKNTKIADYVDRSTTRIRVLS